MTRERIAALLEKYWQTETTVEEERELAEYFRGPDVPQEWASYRELFSFFSQVGDMEPGPHLEERIMRQVYARPRQPTAWWAAAAVIMVVMGLIYLIQPAPRVEMKDTYDDPQQALAAVQKALFKVSKKMNEGLHPIKQ